MGLGEAAFPHIHTSPGRADRAWERGTEFRQPLPGGHALGESLHWRWWEVRGGAHQGAGLHQPGHNQPTCQVLNGKTTRGKNRQTGGDRRRKKE